MTLILIKEISRYLYYQVGNYRIRQANSKEYDVVRSNGMERVKSKDLRVGDIVKIEGGDRVPADLIVLYS